MKSVRTRFVVLTIAALAVSGCGIFKKGTAKTPVLGERVAVLAVEQDVAVDPATAALPMSLPEPVANTEWGQSGGNASKSMGHLAVGQSLGQAWAVSIGKGGDVRARLAGGPVVGDGRVYTIDTQATVRAFDAQTGATVWSTQFGVEKGNNASLFGGGVSFDNGRIYATNGLGYVAALDARNGGIVWQVHPTGPLRGSPTVVGDNVYVITQDNQIYSLKASDGSTAWSQAAALEIAGVFGSASPAAAQGTVVAGFSSGELNAYRYENGRLVWQDQLARTSIRTSVASISDVDADPVIDGGQVFAVGQGGRMVAIDLLTGQRQWELNIAGICDAVGRGRLGLCRDRRRQADCGSANERQDPLDRAAPRFPQCEEEARSDRLFGPGSRRWTPDRRQLGRHFDQRRSGKRLVPEPDEHPRADQSVADRREPDLVHPRR